MWLFVNNQHCFGYIQITTLNNKNTFGAHIPRLVTRDPAGELDIGDQDRLRHGVIDLCKV